MRPSLIRRHRAGTHPVRRTPSSEKRRIWVAVTAAPTESTLLSIPIKRRIGISATEPAAIVSVSVPVAVITVASPAVAVAPTTALACFTETLLHPFDAVFPHLLLIFVKQR